MDIVEWLNSQAALVSNISRPGRDNNYGRAAAEITALRKRVAELEGACRLVSNAAVHVGRGEYSIPQEAMQAVDAALTQGGDNGR